MHLVANNKQNIHTNIFRGGYRPCERYDLHKIGKYNKEIGEIINKIGKNRNFHTESAPDSQNQTKINDELQNT